MNRLLMNFLQSLADNWIADPWVLVTSKRMRVAGDAEGAVASVPMAEINVTPFVDVMLVLLIIFMVAAPLLTVGVPVELPKTAAGALSVDQEEPLTITLTAAGSVQIQTTEVVRNDLLARLRAIAAERSSDKSFFCVQTVLCHIQKSCK